MRIFVTGATGFIGAHFIERALDAGHAVTGLYRSDDARRRQRVAYLRDRGAKLLRGDILDADLLIEAMRDAHCVCHFAAAFREPRAEQAFFDRVNVEGTANVMCAAATQGVRRVVHCSTAGIYGQQVSGIIDERAPIRPANNYERSKLAAETEVRNQARAAGLEYVILRPSAVYGPRDERLMKLFRSVAKGRFPLFGAGEGRRHLIYVTDLADAFLRACTEPGAANQEMIVAGPKAVPLHDLLGSLAHAANRTSFGPQLPLKPMLAVAALVEDLCHVLNVRPPIYRRRMDFYTTDIEFDSGLARRALNWQPKVDLADGLAATLRATQEQESRPALAPAQLSAGGRGAEG
jgi:nucleoside-diphosphate-sugar epimerase